MDFNKNTWNSILFVAELIYSRKVDNWIFWKKWQDSSLGEAWRNEVRYTSWAGKPKKISLKKWQDSSAGESARLIPGRSSVRSRVLLFFSQQFCYMTRLFVKSILTHLLYYVNIFEKMIVFCIIGHFWQLFYELFDRQSGSWHS